MSLHNLFGFMIDKLLKRKLRDQQKEMLQSKEESITQTEQIDDAFDDTASGEVGYGKHHFTLVCYADTQEELNKHVGTLFPVFLMWILPVFVKMLRVNVDSGRNLPGNFGYICRAADISTKNMAAFASFHNYPTGKLKGNHWGDAVTVFETLVRQSLLF